MTDATSDQRPRSHLALLATIFVLFSCCGCPAYYCVIEPWLGELEARYLRADLDKNVPDGSTRERAEAWFASHGFRTNDLIGPDGRRAGLMATIPDVFPPVNGAICIEVGFDDNDKVRKRIVYRVVYSL